MMAPAGLITRQLQQQQEQPATGELQAAAPEAGASGTASARGVAAQASAHEAVAASEEVCCIIALTARSGFLFRKTSRAWCDTAGAYRHIFDWPEWQAEHGCTEPPRVQHTPPHPSLPICCLDLRAGTVREAPLEECQPEGGQRRARRQPYSWLQLPACRRGALKETYAGGFRPLSSGDPGAEPLRVLLLQGACACAGAQPQWSSEGAGPSMLFVPGTIATSK